MQVYNIRKSKYAKSLDASGQANRWNRAEEYVLYSGGSIALAALELLAHRSGIQLEDDFKLLTINLDLQESEIPKIKLAELPSNWRSVFSYPVLQGLGSRWYNEGIHLALEVPSALIPLESNFLINTKHPEFSNRVTLNSSIDFEWDQRLF